MTVRILEGDCRKVLPTLAAGSIDCCVTSPPYFQLRDYGHPDQIGMEPTPELFVEQLVGVFREVRRVLADHGTLWLNLGDSYASRPNGSTGKESSLDGQFTAHTEFRRAHAKRSAGLPAGLKHKDLIGVPWMAAFALRADGWYLRQEIIWSKPNTMPESTTDRCTKSHEHVFLLSKSHRYHFDANAIAEEATTDPSSPRNRWDRDADDVPGQKPQKRVARSGNRERKPRPGPAGDPRNQMGNVPWEGTTRNRRSVWSIATSRYTGAHFATMAPELAELCIRAGCPPGGTVLDPFGGAGTTGLVADQLQRDAVLIELNSDYAGLSQQRIVSDAPLFTTVQATSTT